jgi:DNA-binding MarR family transcriptional regulator
LLLNNGPEHHREWAVKKISNIGSLLKKNYRAYSGQILQRLSQRGFTDIRPSFLEVLLCICENDGPSIKRIGQACALKKQTMTSHLNELENRGYVSRKVNEQDKREQNIFLTEYGERFKLNLLEIIGELEKLFGEVIGEVELDRVEMILKNFYEKLSLKRPL